jgi:hypothetical protein
LDERADVVRPQLDRPPEGAGCVLQATLVQERVAELAPRVSVPRLEVDGLGEVVDGIGKIELGAGLTRQPQQVHVRRLLAEPALGELAAGLEVPAFEECERLFVPPVGCRGLRRQASDTAR